MKKFNQLVLAMGCAALLFTGITLADTHTMGCPMGRDKADIVEKMQQVAQKLNLTDTQRSELKQLVEKSRPQIREYRNQIRQAKESLMKSMMNGQYNESKVKTWAQQQADAMEKLVVLRAQTQHQIYMILTQEQRDTLRQMMRDRMGKRHPDLM